MHLYGSGKGVIEFRESFSLRQKVIIIENQILSPYCFVQKRCMSAKSWLFVLISEHINSEPSIKAMSALRVDDDDDINFSFCFG